MSIVWVNVLFLTALAVFGGLVAAAGAILLDRLLEMRREIRERKELNRGA